MVSKGEARSQLVLLDRGSFAYQLHGISGGCNFHFLAGLGFTEITNAVVELSIQKGAPNAFKVIAAVFDLIVVISFALAGYFSNKLVSPVFLAGIIIYTIDTIIVLFLGDFLMAAFHAFALYSLIRGFIACRSIKTYHNVNMTAAPPPALG